MNDYKALIGCRVLIFTDFMTFDGTMTRAGSELLVLEHAAAVADDGGRQPIDGHARIPRGRVLWVQVP